MTTTDENAEAEAAAFVRAVAEEDLAAAVAEMTIFHRMIAILGELPAIGKTQQNTQQNFMYRGHDDVLNALNPLLAKYGVFVVPHVVERLTDTRTTQRGSTMYEVNLHVSFTFYGAQGDWIAASAWGEGTDSGDKATNKAMTMAFKNVLAQAFAISTAELSDADAGSPEETTRGDRAPARQQTGARPAAAEFDPGKKLLDGAPNGPDTFKMIEARQNHADPSLDWKALATGLRLDRYGKEQVADLDAAERADFLMRYSNALTKLTDSMTGDIPAATDDEIRAAFGWAFPGTIVAIPVDTPPPDTAGASTDATEAGEEPAAGGGEPADAQKGDQRHADLDEEAFRAVSGDG